MDGSAGFPGAGGRADLPLKFRIPRAVQERSGHRMGSTNKSKVQKPIFPILGKFKKKIPMVFSGEGLSMVFFRCSRHLAKSLKILAKKGSKVFFESV